MPSLTALESFGVDRKRGVSSVLLCIMSSDEKNGDRMKIVLPNSLYNNSNGECTLLVQIDPEDSSKLDFTGAVGAIGRMEADSTGGKREKRTHLLL